MHRFWIVLTGLFLISYPAAQEILGQTTHYKQTNIVSSTRGHAPNVDESLLSPASLASSDASAFLIANNKSGSATFFSPRGAALNNIRIPGSAESSLPSSPSAIIANKSGVGFDVDGRSSQFIFATEDGTLAAWNGRDAATVVVDNSKNGAVYKSMALLNNKLGTYLLVANFRSGTVDVFDSTFRAASLPGNFHDPELPSGFAPLGIHVIESQVLVAFAKQDEARRDPVSEPGAGFVDLFDLEGNFMRRVVSQEMLNAPRGVVLAPGSFGNLGGKLLIGNFGDGTINAFDFATGAFAGQMKDVHGAPIVNASLADMAFSVGRAATDPATLYLVGGSSPGQDGLFASITATPEAGTADFTITADPTTATVTAGQSMNFTVTVTSMNSFADAVSFSCSGLPLYTSCTFTPPTVTPASGAMATTRLTLGTQSSGGGGTYNPMGFFPDSPSGPFGPLGTSLMLLASFALAKFCIPGRTRRPGKRRRSSLFDLLGVACLLVTITTVFFLSGCGGYNSSTAPTPRGMSTLVITGSSTGGLSHSTNVSLTVQ
jgi:uncharacterized protein (TIGR03118 family)